MNRSTFALVAAVAVPLSATAAAPAQAQDCIARDQAEVLVSTLKQRNEQLRDLSQRLQEMEARSAKVDASLAELENSRKLIAIAVEKNRELAAIGEAIIADYEKLNLGSRVAAREPLTQLYRVRLENKLESFRDQLDAQGFHPDRELDTVTPAAAAPAASEAPPARP